MKRSTSSVGHGLAVLGFFTLTPFAVVLGLAPFIAFVGLLLTLVFGWDVSFLVQRGINPWWLLVALFGLNMLAGIGRAVVAPRDEINEVLDVLVDIRRAIERRDDKVDHETTP